MFKREDDPDRKMKLPHGIQQRRQANGATLFRLRGRGRRDVLEPCSPFARRPRDSGQLGKQAGTAGTASRS